MNQQEFENGIKVDLSYIPYKLRGEWFREVEVYYMNKCTTKEQAYSRFRREIKQRVKELKEWKFSSNLELQACISLALKRLDKKFGPDGAIRRHDWEKHLSYVVGSDEQAQSYGEINDAIRAIQARLHEVQKPWELEEAEDEIIGDYAARLIAAVRSTAKFDGYESEYSHDRENKEVALAIVLYIVSEYDPEYYNQHEYTVMSYNKLNRLSCWSN